jgi:hypothetical protein
MNIDPYVRLPGNAVDEWVNRPSQEIDADTARHSHPYRGSDAWRVRRNLGGPDLGCAGDSANLRLTSSA